MKTRKILIVLLVLVGIMSCKNDIDHPQALDLTDMIELTPDELISVSYDNAGEITSEEAIEIVGAFQEMLDGTTVTRSSFGSDFVIKDAYSIGFDGTKLLDDVATRSVSEDILVAPIYEVSVNGGNGLILVSGDERAPSIIAYVPELPNKYGIDSPEMDFMLQWSKASFMASLQKQKDIRNELKDVTIQKIASALCIAPKEVTPQVIAANTYVKYEGEVHTRTSRPVHSIPGQIYGYCAPLLQTNWAQGSPYNSKLPIHDKVSDGWGGYSQDHVFAGCAVVNLAQLYAFCEPTMVANGTNINWALLKETPTIGNFSSDDKKSMVADLMKQLYEESGAHNSYDGNGVVTGTGVFAGDFIRVLKSRVNANDHIGYNADVVYTSLKSFLPCVIRGEGHSFAIDGYIISDKIARQILKMRDMYWHAVLGWGGQTTAWYKIDSDTHLIFETGGHQFDTHNLMILSHVRPK